MVETPQYREWMREAKGEIRGRAQALLRLLAKKFHPGPPTSLAARIQAGANAVEITRWFDAAIDSASFEEFRLRSGL